MTSKTRACKVLFVINSLEGGGAERVVCTLASALAEAEEHWAVTLVTLDRGEDMYAPSPRVTRTPLDSGGRLLSSIHVLLRVMRENRPDVVVSFLTRANCAAIACSRLLRIPCIISERVHTTSHFSSGGFRGLRKLAVRCFYPYADRVIAVSRGVGDDLVRNYGLTTRQMVTIHNTIEIDRIAHAARAEPSIVLPADYIVAVGRLVTNKNFSMLLRSYARANITSALVILGEGPERSGLTALAAALGIADRVHMPGYIPNPHAIVARARFYVSSSNAEGFPNAMLEAMCVRQPVVATDCDSGPAEILQGETGGPKALTLTRAPFGILVPTDDEHAMSAALRVMEDPETRARFAVAAWRRAHQFDPGHVISRYKAVISAVVPIAAFRGRTAESL
ncbi:glycosyltransferase [Microvirga brassicacearum]|uniref:Glycosyltransferase n=1 Tax=Microvirga brassicacearum TaxID=2580413 RepID=A0A5N3PJ40_9HYPH|nr:glycosyltransferase [Microvirga brassicacearum]KAB0269759.1 glycosyltransferase [Microvirga brassicacearum]